MFYLAAALFLANFVLGLLVQFQVVESSPFKWLHHALFFAAFVSAGAATLVGYLQGAPYPWPLLGVLALFAVLARVRAGTPWHAALACAALALYAVGFAGRCRVPTLAFAVMALAVAAVAAQRLLEVCLSRRNERRARVQGAIEYGQGHYPAIPERGWLLTLRASVPRPSPRRA